MFLLRSVVYFILLAPGFNNYPQINLYMTDETIDDKMIDTIHQHNCLYVDTSMNDERNADQIISYCMSERPSKWHIHTSNHDEIFTFAELYQRKITSHQLCTWSAPMDVVERYQLYLNELTNSNQTQMSTQLFYNCTLSYFGSVCQYSIDDYNPHQSSLYEIINQFYSYEYESNTFTCYIHVQCNRGQYPSCLDWSEICDGKIDCMDGGLDEEHCWQLEINNCEEDEYRCRNGQCIPYTFFRDDHVVPDCLDGSDEVAKNPHIYDDCDRSEPTLACEDIVCAINSDYMQSPLTSSCKIKRNDLLLKTMFLKKSDSIFDSCWSALICILHIEPMPISKQCISRCQSGACDEIINNTCPHMLYLPTVPIIFNEVYFVYTKENTRFSLLSAPAPDYICFKGQLCSEFFSKYKHILLQNTTCYSPTSLELKYFPSRNTWTHLYVTPLLKLLHKCYAIMSNSSTLCNRSTMYQCVNSSKCINQDRLNDGIVDCFYLDDEQFDVSNNTYSLERVKKHFKCQNTNQYISYRLVNDGNCHCNEYENELCDDEFSNIHFSRKHISFQTICDGFTELIPLVINGRNETDETDCEQWYCNNTYTRCNGFWNCLNGADEVDCDSQPLLSCPLLHHICVSNQTKQLTCLPIKKANDGNIDCIGATDEPILCRKNHHIHTDAYFYCGNNSQRTCIYSSDLCDRYGHCKYRDDELFCDENRNITVYNTICNTWHIDKRSYVENFFCERLKDSHKPTVVHFQLSSDGNLINNVTKSNENRIHTHLFSRQTRQNCHRGFPLRVWLDKYRNLTITTCLCPPSFYGDVCQYQNQRISLTLQFRALSDAWRTPFVLVVLLIDDSDEKTIHSHEQITYLPIRDCHVKFHAYLLYLLRPKIHSRNYSVHIDIYEKFSLTYRGSWLLSLRFSFLPVHRLVAQLDIPPNFVSIERCSDKRCVHGYCTRYSNKQNNYTTFCRCQQGWSGQYCTIPHACKCSLESLCIGTLANNRSLCVCPINRFGSQCLLNNTLCELDPNTKCLNGGQCIPVSEHTGPKKKFKCICSKGFSGIRCELADTKIIISFHTNIRVSQAMLIHFIRVINNTPPERVTTFKATPVHQNSITIYWSHPFHLIFLELLNKSYYLAVVQKQFQPSIQILKKIDPSDRCEHINDLFNETIIKLHLIRRIKYYHIPCQEHSSNLSCFYDDTHLCLCENHGLHRLANCFEFDHQMKMDCLGQSGCENGAQCFQDSSDCSQTSICVCPPCFYGVRCQFSTSGFGLSLDAILGYHILPNVSILHQRYAVQFSAVLTTIMVVVGLINGTFSLITFQNKKLREAGCGSYLIGSSITTLLTMTLFGFKFWILLSSQMSLTINKVFLYAQCLMIDFLIRICLSMDQWLNACVAAERAITALQKAQFNKKKSKKIAKYVIIALFVLTTSTAIHDPIHRRLFDDNDGDEKRIWCIVTYSPRLQQFNSAIHLFHFFAPFFINLISSVAILRAKARQKAIVQPHCTYGQLLREQFQQHNRLVIAPFILVILAFPRVVISFVSGCMKSAKQSWVFLMGYFISFFPPMLTFLIFVLPSKLYTEEFRKSVKKCWTIIKM
ncbi:unnamed protein product [Rotaria magnacalcarata]|uniref:Uncharacterized protein n=2 Tax=Rotaria magnacalcarata TaxID=392030 RepID=A0A816LXG5_9BILA|nr:unnamed protein product [Rotaria magnacalcarata]CAF1965180.1 unnamed protein product [Rotaria magnacalcarata]CAF4007457.1 unnamed protein product [Rotaria magnacalcarata]CAF4078177.1 unnamed protein product [Rotaria magnacalcarata]